MKVVAAAATRPGWQTQRPQFHYEDQDDNHHDNHCGDHQDGQDNGHDCDHNQLLDEGHEDGC